MQFHCRVGDHKLDRLTLRQRPAEGDTDFRVVDHHIEGALGDADRTRAVAADTALADPLLGQRKTAANLADDIGGRDTDVFKKNLPGRFAHHRWPLPFERDAGAFEIDGKAGDTAAGAFFRIG